MYQAKSNEYKYEIERMNGDYKEKKREFYEIKRREQLMQEEEAQLQQQVNEIAKNEEEGDIQVI